MNGTELTEPRNSQPEDNIFNTDAKKVLLDILEFLRKHDFMFCEH